MRRTPVASGRRSTRPFARLRCLRDLGPRASVSIRPTASWTVPGAPPHGSRSRARTIGCRIAAPARSPRIPPGSCVRPRIPPASTRARRHRTALARKSTVELDQDGPSRVRRRRGLEETAPGHPVSRPDKKRRWSALCPCHRAGGHRHPNPSPRRRSRSFGTRSSPRGPTSASSLASRAMPTLFRRNRRSPFASRCSWPRARRAYW